MPALSLLASKRAPRTTRRCHLAVSTWLHLPLLLFQAQPSTSVVELRRRSGQTLQDAAEAVVSRDADVMTQTKASSASDVASVRASVPEGWKGVSSEADGLSTNFMRREASLQESLEPQWHHDEDEAELLPSMQVLEPSTPELVRRAMVLVLRGHHCENGDHKGVGIGVSLQTCSQFVRGDSSCSTYFQFCPTLGGLCTCATACGNNPTCSDRTSKTEFHACSIYQLLPNTGGVALTTPECSPTTPALTPTSPTTLPTDLAQASAPMLASATGTLSATMITAASQPPTLQLPPLSPTLQPSVVMARAVVAPPSLTQTPQSPLPTQLATAARATQPPPSPLPAPRISSQWPPLPALQAALAYVPPLLRQTQAPQPSPQPPVPVLSTATVAASPTQIRPVFQLPPQQPSSQPSTLAAHAAMSLALPPQSQPQSSIVPSAQPTAPSAATPITTSTAIHSSLSRPVVPQPSPQPAPPPQVAKQTPVPPASFQQTPLPRPSSQPPDPLPRQAPTAIGTAQQDTILQPARLPPSKPAPVTIFAVSPPPSPAQASQMLTSTQRPGMAPAAQPLFNTIPTLRSSEPLPPLRMATAAPVEPTRFQQAPRPSPQPLDLPPRTAANAVAALLTPQPVALSVVAAHESKPLPRFPQASRPDAAFATAAALATTVTAEPVPLQRFLLPSPHTELLPQQPARVVATSTELGPVQQGILASPQAEPSQPQQPATAVQLPTTPAPSLGATLAPVPTAMPTLETTPAPTLAPTLAQSVATEVPFRLEMIGEWCDTNAGAVLGALHGSSYTLDACMANCSADIECNYVAFDGAMGWCSTYKACGMMMLAPRGYEQAATLWVVYKKQVYDCRDGLISWDSGWTMAKRKWCCARFGVGCDAEAQHKGPLQHPYQGLPPTSIARDQSTTPLPLQAMPAMQTQAPAHEVIPLTTATPAPLQVPTTTDVHAGNNSRLDGKPRDTDGNTSSTSSAPVVRPSSANSTGGGASSLALPSQRPMPNRSFDNVNGSNISHEMQAIAPTGAPGVATNVSSNPTEKAAPTGTPAIVEALAQSNHSMLVLRPKSTSAFNSISMDLKDDVSSLWTPVQTGAPTQERLGDNDTAGTTFAQSEGVTLTTTIAAVGAMSPGLSVSSGGTGALSPMRALPPSGTSRAPPELEQRVKEPRPQHFVRRVTKDPLDTSGDVITTSASKSGLEEVHIDGTGSRNRSNWRQPPCAALVAFCNLLGVLRALRVERCS